MNASRRLGSGAGLLLCLLGTASRGAEGEEPRAESTQAVMHQIFGAVQRTLPDSLDEARFSDPERRAAIGYELGVLAKYAEQLGQHGTTAEVGFGFLSASLARNARTLKSRYELGRYREASYALHAIVVTCATCHARLPSPSDTSFSVRLMDDAAIAALSLPERATVAMATRQFEQALRAQEAIFVSEDYDVSSIDLLGYVEDYLEICLRVKNDYERPAKTLDRFAKRPGIRPGLRRNVLQWVEDLRELGGREPIVGFEPARALVEEAEAKAPPMGERSQLVRYVAASGAFHRLLAALESRGPRAAEVYYWLGIIELRIGRVGSLSQAETYLDAAIRLAPGDAQAERAYVLLEDAVVLGYTGSGGVRVPSDIRAWLDDLYRLIVAARNER